MFGLTYGDLSIVVGAMAITVVLSMYVVRVPRGQVFLVERFGQYHRTLEAGLNIVPPMTNRIAKKLNLDHAFHIDFEIETKTGIVIVNGPAALHVKDPIKAAYSVADFNRSVKDLIANRCIAATKKMNAQEMIAGKQKVIAETLRAAQKAATDWGIEITKLELDIFDA